MDRFIYPKSEPMYLSPMIPGSVGVSPRCQSAASAAAVVYAPPLSGFLLYVSPSPLSPTHSYKKNAEKKR